jgi:hypothetical protein
MGTGVQIKGGGVLGVRLGLFYYSIIVDPLEPLSVTAPAEQMLSQKVIHSMLVLCRLSCVPVKDILVWL